MLATMKIQTLIYIFALVVLMRTAFANFDVYRVDEVHYPPDWKRHARDIGGNVTHSGNHTTENWSHSHWSAVPHNPTCTRLFKASWRDDKNDISGNKLGIRCRGEGCNNDHSTPGSPNIELLEMHWSNDPLFHWTIYHDHLDQAGHWLLWGLDGLSYGSCAPIGQRAVTDFDCHDHPVGLGATVTLFVHRKFQCWSSWTAEDIDGGT